jgi:hypothetical protein
MLQGRADVNGPDTRSGDVLSRTLVVAGARLTAAGSTRPGSAAPGGLAPFVAVVDVLEHLAIAAATGLALAMDAL